MDITYVEDFLLTYRTFFEDSKTIANKLLVWFDDEKYRAKVHIFDIFNYLFHAGFLHYLSLY